MNWFRLNGNVAFKSVIHIPLWIFIAKELEVIFRFFGLEIASPPTSQNWFISGFIEWFGVLYGILLPLILVRAWEQLDDIDREFDREADTVKIFYKDLYYLSSLPDEAGNIGKEIANLLHAYVRHVTTHFRDEIKGKGSERRKGDEILEQIRKRFRDLIQPNLMELKVHEFLIKELLDRLNEILDIRGDRISLASQRVFESLRTVALITSIVFLVPFYFAGLTSLYLLDIALIVSVTFLAIYIYMIIEDLDEPFEGAKKISDESWQLLLVEMNLDLTQPEQKVQNTKNVMSGGREHKKKIK